MRLMRLLLAAVSAVGLTAGAASAETITFTSLPQGTLINFQVTVLAKMLLEKTDLKVRVAPMRGTSAQVAAIERGQAEFMLIDVTQAAAALEGKESWKGRPVKKLRAAARLLSFPVGIMVRNDSPIHSMADLKGKRLPSGFKAFPQGEILIRAQLATAGLTMNDVVGVPAPELVRSWNDFKAGRTDAVGIVPTAPKAREINAALGGVRFINIPDTPQSLAAVKSLRKDFYLMTVKPSPANTGVHEPTTMLAFDLAIATGTDVPDSTVEKLLQAVHDNKAELARAHATFRGFNPAGMGKQFSVLRYHPGAEAWLKQAGLWKGQ